MPLMGRNGKSVLASLALGGFLLALFAYVPLYAQDNSAIAQGFQTQDPNMAVGALASLKTTSGNSIELANITTAEQLVGVVADKPLIGLDTENTQIQVVTSGVTLALVSDINGSVKTGDKITASPIDGVGMKTQRSATIVGTAQADLTSAKVTERTITDTSGQQHTVKIGSIPVQVNVTFYASPEERTTILPPFLQNMANALAGREVAAIRVVLAAAVLVLSLISVAVLLYSSVQSSIISIGRNPLSEGAVRKGLLQVGFTIFGILLLTVIAIYLILRI